MQQRKLSLAYDYILDHADYHWRDPVWSFFYDEISFATFKIESVHFDLDSEESVAKFFRKWAERRWKLKSFL